MDEPGRISASDSYVLATSTPRSVSPCQSVDPIRSGADGSTWMPPRSTSVYGSTCFVGTPYIQLENQFQSDLPSRTMSSTSITEARPRALR